MPNSQKGEIVVDYIKSMTSDFNNRTLARKIVQENPHVFEQTEKEVENVRGRIRQYRGASGESNRKEFKNKLWVREEKKVSEYMADYMAKGEENDTPPIWHLPPHLKKVLILSDIHIPYHVYDAVMAALDYGMEQGVDAIYLNGDIVDFKDISRWDKEPDAIRLHDEIDMVREFLQGLAGVGLPVFYKLGNHEDRWQKKIMRDAPEFAKLDALKLENVLGLNDLGIELIASGTRAQFGNLTVIHGHEFGETLFSPVNPARGLFLRAKSSILSGHYHQRSQHGEANIMGEETRCYSTGCLCDLSPKYRPFAFTKWKHGAAIVEVNPDKTFQVFNFEIKEGQIIY